MFRVRPTAATRANTAPAPCLTRIDARPGRSDTSKELWDARKNFGGEIFGPASQEMLLARGWEGTPDRDAWSPGRPGYGAPRAFSYVPDGPCLTWIDAKAGARA